MKRRRPKVSMAPMAVTSTGEVLVNAYQLGREDHLEAVVEAARTTGLAVFVGVAILPRLREHVLDDVDDVLADVVGRLGPKLTASAPSSASTSSRSAADARPGGQDRRAVRIPRRQGRRRGP